jgi:Alanyl-tRNA synthetase
MLRRFSDKAKDQDEVFSIFMTDDGEKVSYIVTSKADGNFSSKDLIELVNSSFDGSGGGRNDFAQGGSQDNSNISDKFENLKSKLEDLI